MKIKKLIVVMIAACMLVMSQAAYATEVSPTAIGIGDTRGAAIPLANSFNDVKLFLSSYSDYDWYVWTNNTSTHKFVTGLLYNNNGNFELAAQTSILGDLSSLVFNPENSFSSIYLPPGGSVYFRVGAVSGQTNISQNYNLIVNTWTP